MPLAELAEYAKAKEEGEQLCHSFADKDHMAIFAPRLPRTVTDQTASMVAAEAVDPLDVMLPLVQQMTAAKGGRSNA